MTTSVEKHIIYNMQRYKDLSGKYFGRLKVIARISVTKYRDSVWLCRCRCGKEKHIRGGNLKNGHTKSCGCLNVDIQKSKRTIAYKYRGTKLWWAFSHIRQRCNNAKNGSYKNYGGRGIKCEWKNFDEFLKDNLRKFNYAKKKYPNEKLSIERKDVNGNYNKKNVTWIPMRDQAKNTRRNHKLTLHKKTMNIADWPRTEWCKKLKISERDIDNRLRAGWSIEKTLTTPVRKINS